MLKRHGLMFNISIYSSFGKPRCAAMDRRGLWFLHVIPLFAIRASYRPRLNDTNEVMPL
jgi:hypothetical protein